MPQLSSNHSDIGEIEDYICDQLEIFEDKSYNPDYMEMDGTYGQNIQIPLPFTYGAVPESIFNCHVYNKPGCLIRFKDPLKAYAVAGDFNCVD